MGARVRWISKRRRWQATAVHRGRRICRDFEVRAQAAAWAATTFGAMALGKPLAEAGRAAQTLAKWIETFKAKYSTNTRDGVTFKPVVELLGNHRIDRIAEWNIRRYIAARRDAEVSSKAINHEVTGLRHALYVAVRVGALAARPQIEWHALLLPTRPRDRVATPGELAAIREHLPAYVRDALDLALLTGLRRGDLFNLTRDQIDTRAGTLTIQQRKNARPLVMPLSAAALAIVERNLPNLDRVGVLLVNARGKRLQTIQKPWYAALEAAGITGLRWHDLRHTFATRAVEAGAPRDVLAALLGDTPQVAALYSTPSLEHKRRLVEIVCRTGVADLTALHYTPQHSTEHENTVGMGHLPTVATGRVMVAPTGLEPVKPIRITRNNRKR